MSQHNPAIDPEEPATAGSFGEAAGEMGSDTEVEEPLVAGQSAADVDADEAAEGGTDGAEDELDDELTRAQADVAALTGDLQRLQAEYVNYKRRVDRDRDLVRENAKYTALAPIIDVLDTIDRAREHGELEGGFAAVADQLERVVATQGLTRFGTPGDAFDPMLHEALSHLGADAEVEVTTCKVIAKAGYRMGDRVVRAAQVLVVDPE